MLFHDDSDRYGLLIDLGSGSVGVALCHSNNQKHPHIIWSRREHTPLRNIESINDSSRAIITTLMNCMMEFEGQGRATLTAYNPKAKVTTVQATVSAPWSYTTVKTIKFTQDESFVVSKSLIDDLASAAHEQAIADFTTQNSLESMGIAQTSLCLLDTHANGYRLTSLHHQLATEVTVTQATTLIQTEIIAAIEEMNEKLFGSTTLQMTSYMLVNHFATRLLMPQLYDVCLVDVTDEATEIGIVRDGSLRYSTHVAFGRASIAREIAAATGVPLAEAFSSFATAEAIKTKPELSAIFLAYTNKIKALFKETGDSLTIPKNMYLETDLGVESVFYSIIKTAAESVSHGNVQITNLKKKLQQPSNHNCADTPLLIAANFFHTSGDHGRFEYL